MESSQEKAMHELNRKDEKELRRKEGSAERARRKYCIGYLPRPYAERVALNISGEVFETYFLTLLRFPNTLLGDLRELDQFYCSTSDTYFFDRNRCVTLQFHDIFALLFM